MKLVSLAARANRLGRNLGAIRSAIRQSTWETDSVVVDFVGTVNFLQNCHKSLHLFAQQCGSEAMERRAMILKWYYC